MSLKFFMGLSNETPKVPPGYRVGGLPLWIYHFPPRGGEFAIQHSPGVGGIFHLSNQPCSGQECDGMIVYPLTLF